MKNNRIAIAKRNHKTIFYDLSEESFYESQVLIEKEAKKIHPSILAGIYILCFPLFEMLDRMYKRFGNMSFNIGLLLLLMIVIFISFRHFWRKKLQIAFQDIIYTPISLDSQEIKELAEDEFKKYRKGVKFIIIFLIVMALSIVIFIIWSSFIFLFSSIIFYFATLYLCSNQIYIRGKIFKKLLSEVER